MLTQQGRVQNIYPQAKNESSGHANSARLVDTPKENTNSQKIWQPKGLGQSKQHVNHQGYKKAHSDEPRANRQQQGLTATHDHGGLPLLAFEAVEGCKIKTWRPLSSAKGLA